MECIIIVEKRKTNTPNEGTTYVSGGYALHPLGLKECNSRTLDKKKGNAPKEMFSNSQNISFNGGTPRDLLYATEKDPAKNGATFSLALDMYSKLDALKALIP